MTTGVCLNTVAQVVESIFTTMMEIDVCATDAPWRPNRDRLTSSVYLEGEWNGAVSLVCDRHQAREFAGKFLSMEPPEAIDNDVRDVLGELANMIGGNIKSMMEKNVRLSLPSVIDGSNYELRVCGSHIEEAVGFRFYGGDFWVLVCAQDISLAN